MTFLFNSALEFPAREVVGKNEIKGIQIGKKKMAGEIRDPFFGVNKE